MEIIHNVIMKIGPCEQQAFADIGIKVEIGFQRIPIPGSDPRWTLAKPIALRSKAHIKQEAAFSKADYNEAKHFELFATGHTGYPQPEDDFGYLNATYDLTNYCEKCGAGGVQNAPFRLKNTPVWNKKQVMQLNWVFDEFFVPPLVWEPLFKPFGVECRPTCLKSGANLDTAVQIVIPLSANIDVEGLVIETCMRCGRRKYNLSLAKYAPTPQSSPADVFRSIENFGSGANAFKLITVSAEFYKYAKKVGHRGVDFRPCAP